GSSALRLDVYTRTLDFDRAARASCKDNASPETRNILQRYSDGVNVIWRKGRCQPMSNLPGSGSKLGSRLIHRQLVPSPASYHGPERTQGNCFLRLAQKSGWTKLHG
ncbi:MAG: penicillin acylase family protein, partial [Rhodoferax sp.]|nr:penicillin acylase family protein [Rhodoferax sp.]